MGERVSEPDIVQRAMEVARGTQTEHEAREGLTTEETARFLSYLTQFRSIMYAYKYIKTLEAHQMWLDAIETNYNQSCYIQGVDADGNELSGENDALLADFQYLRQQLEVTKGNALKTVKKSLHSMAQMFVDEEETRKRGELVDVVGNSWEDYGNTTQMRTQDLVDFIDESIDAVRNNPFGSEDKYFDRMVYAMDKAKTLKKRADTLFAVTCVTFIRDVIDSIDLTGGF